MAFLRIRKDLPASEIECNGTPMEIEHCPMFSKSSAPPADFMAQINQHNKFQESFVGAAMSILKAQGMSEGQIEKVKQQVGRQEESQIAFSVAIPFMKATGLSNKRIEIIKSLMKLEGDIDKELDPDDQKDLCDLYNMMLCEYVDPAACMESILRISLGENYPQENIDKMCGVSKLIWKDYIESIEKKTEEEKKIDALKKDNDDLRRQIDAEKE